MKPRHIHLLIGSTGWANERLLQIVTKFEERECTVLHRSNEVRIADDQGGIWVFRVTQPSHIHGYHAPYITYEWEWAEHLHALCGTTLLGRAVQVRL